MYGDHTPLALSGPVNLTPAGANQMYDLGAVFRDRYVRPLRHDDYVGIVGIQPKVIDNSQLLIEASTETCSSASAIAFMQGLYPPYPHTTCDQDVPEHNRFTNGSTLNYPMCGYQYPNIRTMALDRDPDSIWSHGHGMCNKHQASLLMFPNNTLADALHQDSKAFYGGLWDKVFCEAFPLSQANFFNAYDLYEYAAYRFEHDNRTRSSITPGDLEKLRELAWQEQTLKHASIPGPADAQTDMTSAISGRTLASRVAALFAENIESHGERNKLNLAFTSQEPLMAFLALSGLTSGDSSRVFSQLPRPGTVLTFELFSIDSDDTADLYGTDSYHNNNSYDDDSYGDADPFGRADSYSNPKANPYSNSGSYFAKSRRGYGDENMGNYGGEETDVYGGSYHEKPLGSYDQSPYPYGTGNTHDNTTAYPPVERLYVRFLHRSDTSDPRAPFVPYSLLSSGQSSMSFKHFNATMFSIGIANATSWCGVCESDAFFCHGALDHDHHHHHALSIALGASAAAIAISVILLLVNVLT